MPVSVGVYPFGGQGLTCLHCFHADALAIAQGKGNAAALSEALAAQPGLQKVGALLKPLSAHVICGMPHGSNAVPVRKPVFVADSQ